MNVLVIGCGKVGSKLATVLDKLGHDVCIVDRDEEHFELLDHEFSGYTVTGIPIDQDVLRNAGIEGSDAVIAVTQDDNVNIMVSQLAREVFHIDTVLTRIYDPQRENVFSHFNLKTVCPTNLTVDAVCAALEGAVDLTQMTFGTSTISYYALPVPENLVGKTVHDVIPEPGRILFGIQQPDDKLMLADNNQQKLAAGDKLIFAKLVD
ncbi:TrkA family potassium uptake protein [Hydrogenoanaerobacterium sp.]|uniref:potassium channel family protein n=1 Tax=Hydrogenoanaerobacterium sp. TaxID=2953763 RepID=UPI00289E1E6E|nr:TrkA family potassium uptake protein [Hydrogenoanaerobacterium sp.]